jgi:hypothetical protein
VKQSGLTRVLVAFEPDARMPVEEFQDSNTVAKALMQEQTLLGCRGAYVTPSGVRVDPVTEGLAYARGFQGERFMDRRKALEWLFDGNPAAT